MHCKMCLTDSLAVMKPVCSGRKFGPVLVQSRSIWTENVPLSTYRTAVLKGFGRKLYVKDSQSHHYLIHCMGLNVLHVMLMYSE